MESKWQGCVLESPSYRLWKAIERRRWNSIKRAYIWENQTNVIFRLQIRPRRHFLIPWRRTKESWGCIRTHRVNTNNSFISHPIPPLYCSSILIQTLLHTDGVSESLLIIVCLHGSKSAHPSWFYFTQALHIHTNNAPSNIFRRTKDTLQFIWHYIHYFYWASPAL